MEAVGGSGLTADASVAAIRGAPAAGSLAQQPSEQEAQTANLPLQLDALLSGGAAGKEWAVRLDEAGTPAAPVGSEALAAANPLASSSATATVMPTSGQAARAAYQRLQTSTLLADCSGAGAEWLLGGAADLQGEQLAAVAEAEAPEAWPAATSFVSQPAADVSPGELDRSEALSRQPSSRDSQKAQPGAKSLQPACLNPPTSSLTDCSTTGSECTANGDAADDGKELLTAAQAVAAGQDGLGRLAEAADERPPSQPGSEPADACAEHIPERPSSAAAEFFQLLPLPPLDNLPAIPLPPYKAQHAEQLLQQQRAPAWQAGSWQDEQPQHSDGSHLSPTADAAASAAATGRDSDRCASNASAALNSPGSGQLFDLKAAGRLGGAAGAAANSSAAGSNGSINQASSQELEVQQPQQLLINATLGPGQAAAQDEDSGSPAAQLARLLGSPLTPDGSPPAAPGGSASGWASSGSGGRPARITPGISPAGSPPPQEAGDDDSGTAAPPAAGGAPVRSLSQQWLAEQLQREVAALQRQAAELREALVAAEGSAAAHAEQAQLLRGQVGSSEERREAAQQAQAQATAALAAALREQAALQRQAEAEAARRAAAEERQRLLEEQLELMLLERSSLGEAVAAGQGDGGLLSTAAELAAGNALMAEVQLLRRQLEETSAAKHRLAESLRDERAHSASLQARLAAATAAAEQAAARHAEAAAAAGASAAASHAAQQQQVEQLAAQVAALELQLERGRAAAAAGATAASLQHQQQAALADQSVAIADLQRQLHAERATLTEQAALADAAAAQVTQQAAAFSEALLHQQQAAAYWQGQARELERQLEAAASSEGEVKSALQETCTKLVAQQQLCHEQQEELQFLRLKYQQLSARLEAAEAGGAGPGAGTKAQQLQQQGRGSQGGSTGRSARLLLQATLERDSPASSASSTPTGSRLRRTGSGSSAGGGGASANGGGSKLGSWLGLRR